MTDRNRAKEHKRLKREKKRKDIAKRQQLKSTSLAGATGPARCYMVDAWDEGLAQLLVLREDPKRGWAFAEFLIDAWCLGLKDAFGRNDSSPSEFEEVLASCPAEPELVPISLEEARRIVAGAIRWSQMHHFLLPRHYERSVAILGDLGDLASADISEFGGRHAELHYVGREADLRKKLTESLESFTNRPDVVVEFMDEVWPAEMDLAAVEEMADAVVQTAELWANRVREWCSRTGRTPEADLNEACEIALAAGAASANAPGVLANAQDQVMELFLMLAEEADGVNRAAGRRTNIRKAADQLREFSDSDEGERFGAELQGPGMGPPPNR